MYPSITSNSSDPEAPLNVATKVYLLVRFLGKFEITHGDMSVDVGSNAKALAILRYLLAYPERSVSRDYLMDWLWPEASLLRAKSSLNSAICALRKIVLWREDLSIACMKDCIVLKERYYRLSPHLNVYSDRDEFEGHYRRACMLEEDRRMPEAISEYNWALELYGDDFLVEYLYEEWTFIEREQLLNIYLDILMRFAAYYASTGCYRACIETCYRALRKDPCQEWSHRLLMKCYVCQGMRAKALRQYELCEKILRQTHDISPSPEIKALRRSLG